MYGAVGTVAAFVVALLFILWRPRGLNPAVPATIGALLALLFGSVTIPDLLNIFTLISGASITIVATIAMAILLESFGFYRWAAQGLAARARGSGLRLFWYTNLLCFLMTLFFNNDGSILITTPILIVLLEHLHLKNEQKIPYLLSGALIATASSAPIGVSNIVNLIALDIVGMDLYMHSVMMFVPSMLGLGFFVGCLYLCFRRSLPERIPESVALDDASPADRRRQNRTMRNILLFVFVVRAGLFLSSYFHLPIEIAAVVGTIALLGWRWARLGISPADMAKKTPWHILIFAYGMYVMIYGLNNVGLADALVRIVSPVVTDDLFRVSYAIGAIMTALSVLFNNHPALLIGTLALTSMPLDPLLLKVAYLASIIGSDLGALLVPIGTLASLIWMSVLRRHGIRVTWRTYMRVTLVTVPPTLVVSLGLLALWVEWLF